MITTRVGADEKLCCIDPSLRCASDMCMAWMPLDDERGFCGRAARPVEALDPLVPRLTAALKQAMGPT